MFNHRTFWFNLIKNNIDKVYVKRDKMKFEKKIFWYYTCTSEFVVLNSEQNLTDAELEKVSKYIGSKYQLIGVALGLTTVQIDQVLMANTYCGRTQIFRMLVAWRDSNEEATIQKLINVLTEYISYENVNLVREIFERWSGIVIRFLTPEMNNVNCVPWIFENKRKSLCLSFKSFSQLTWYLF